MMLFSSVVFLDSKIIKNNTQRVARFVQNNFAKVLAVLVFGAMVLGVNGVKAQIYTNTFTGASACPTNGNTPTMATNSTGTAVSRTTTTCNSTANVFNSTTLNATSSISNTSYIEFSATANAGYILNLTSVSFFRQGSSTAPNKIEVRYSTDGFATSTSWGLAPVTSTSNSVLTWDFTDFSTAAAGTVRFRIYPFGVTRCDGNPNPASSGGTFRVDDVTINGTVTSAITTYSNTYNGNGNTSGTVPVDAASPYVSGATVTVLGNTGTLARTGYTFAGWNTLANGSGTDRAAGSTFTISANTTLFAKWTANSNTITFDGNGSTGGSTAAQNINTAASANLTANGFIRAGYTFAGWNTLANGTGTSYTDQVAYTMGTANVTLYAQWTANSLTVTYDSQGGSAISNGSTTTGSTVSNPGNPTRSGYSFNGWFVASSGGSAISFPYTHGQTANFTLYAQWTVVSTPTINPVTLATALSTTYGTASSDASFTASGSNLSVNITADAQTGFEVSTDNSNFVSSVSVSSGTMVYVRFTATQVAGSYNSSTAVVLSSTGAISQNVTTSATGNNVLAKDLTITGISISNKTYDGNTTASISGIAAYSGLVNGQSFPVTGSPSASFNNKNAGTAKPITVSGYTAPSANYSITQPTGLTADITTKALTVISPAVTTKTYDGTTSATITGTLSGVESGDAVTLSGTGTFASANVGTGISVTSTSTLGGADAANYTLTHPTGLSGDITGASQNITFASLTPATLSTADYSPGATASSGLTVTYTSSNPCVATIVGGNIHIVGVGTTTITASQSGGGNYSAATSVNQTLTVMNPTSTLAAGDVVVIAYNSNATPDNFAILFTTDVAAGTVFYVNDNELASSSTTNFTDLNEAEASFTVKAGQTIAAGTVIVLPWSGAVSVTQYDWSNPNGGLGNNNDEIYIYTASSISATTPDGFISYTKIGSSTSAIPSTLSLGTTAINPSGTALRYATSGATYSGTKATLLTAIGNTSSNWNTTGATSFAATDWSFSVSPSPLITSSGTLSAVNTTYGTASASPTSFSVSASGLTADLTLTAPSGFEISSGSGYATSLTISPNACGAIASTTIYVRLAATTAVGTYSGNIVLSSTGATSVNVATVSSSVSEKALTIINLTASDKNYDGLTTVTVSGTAAYSGLMNGESFSVSGTVSWAFPNATVENNKILTRTGNYAAPSANYTVTQPSLTASITTRTLTITASDVNKPFGAILTGASGSTAFVSSGLQNGETIGSVTIAYGNGAASTDAVGTYSGQVTPSDATGGTFTAANYAITYVSGNIIISETPTLDAVILFSPLTTTYGTASTGVAFVATGSNLVGNITATAQSGYEVSSDNSSYSSSVIISSGTTVYVRFTATLAAGTYNNALVAVLSSSGATDANVTTSSSGNTVSTKVLTISGISISNKVYDGNTTATITGTAAYSGLANGESFAVTGTPSAVFSDKNVGVNKTITVTGYLAPSSNYSISQPSGLLANITTATLSLTSASVTTKVYDGITAATITGTLSGVISPDAVTLVGTGTFASADVGTSISVTSIATLGGADAGNYSLTQPTGLTGDITMKALTITATDVSKEMGVLLTGGVGSASFTSSGLAGSETIGSVTITYGAASGTTGQGATPGTYSGQVTPSAATGGTFIVANYSITYSSGSIIVSGFTPGNIVVNRIGNGSTTLGSAASAINIVELNTSGTTQQTISTLFTSTNLLTESGTTTSNGQINSYNTLLGVPGYNSALGTASVNSSNTKATNILGAGATVVNRVVFPTSGSPLPFTANNFRSIVPSSSSTFYASGDGSSSTGGIWYYNGSAFTQVSTTKTNTRNVEIFNGNLYFSTGSATAGIYQVGTGLPSSSGQTATLIAAAASPYGFSMSPDGITMYVADDGTVNGNTGGGVQKWTKSGATWTRQYTFAIQARGIMVDYSGSDAVIYATTTATSNNKIIKITDTGSGANSSDVLLAGSNYVFRGVDFTPAAAPSAPTIGTLTQTTCASATGSIELTGLPSGQWRIYGFPSGSAVGTGSSTTISGLSAGSYTFIVTSYTGRTSVASASATINAQPGAPGYPVTPTASAQSFCNALSTALVSDLAATGTAIQWYSASSGGTPITPSTALASGTYYATQTISTCESQTRTSVAVTLNTLTLSATPAVDDLIWHGRTNTDFGTTSNWYIYNGTTCVSASAAPSATSSIIIPANQAVCVLLQPSTLANSGSVKNITIEASASLTMQDGTMTVAGNWENNGTFNPGTGTVAFNGTSDQTISNTAGETFNIMTINKASGVVLLSNNLTINSALNLTNGIIDLQASNINMASNTVNGGSATSYVRTSGAGVLKRNVSNSAVIFPVGNGAYNPATLTNSATSDEFSLRVYDYVSSTGVEGGVPTSGQAVNRTWMVSEALTGGSNVTLKMQWNTGEEVNGFVYSPGFMNVNHHNGSIWEELGVLNESNSPFFVEQTGITSFSPFTIGITGSPLPIELISFQANCQGTDQVAVTWSTASEHNTSHFVVEKSRDGVNWVNLKSLDAAGNSTTIIEYAVTDTDVSNGISYYRLTQLDTDGASETFNIASVNCGAQAITSKLVTYPNPSNGSFYLDFYSYDLTGPSSISVFDSRGLIIYTQEVLVEKGSNVFHIEKMEAAPGMYYIQVSNGATTSYIVKHSLR